jgi:hypothetical protein
LSEIGQKVVKKLSKSCQKVVKKLTKSCQNVFKICQIFCQALKFSHTFVKHMSKFSNIGKGCGEEESEEEEEEEEEEDCWLLDQMRLRRTW